MESSDPLTFRAYISPRPGNRFLVTVMSPLLSAPLHRSYPEEIGADAAVERAVGHAVATRYCSAAWAEDGGDVAGGSGVEAP